MIQNDIYNEISNITVKTVELGLTIQQNFPYRKGSSISCKEGADLSKVLRNISYKEKYYVLNEDSNYNLKMIDGALIQFMYSFNANGSEMLSHRLAYFPAPHLPNYEDDPEGHETKYFGQSEFHDLIDSNVIKTPMRFDYSYEESHFKDVDHPYSHFHIGEYESCRIPTIQPLCPSVFINFILRNFYNTALKEYCNDFSFPISTIFPATITAKERKIIHFGF